MMTDPIAPIQPITDALSSTAMTVIDDGESAAKKATAKARETALTVARKTADGIEGNPLSVLVGGIAVGVVIGAMVPRHSRETRALGSVGRQLTRGSMAAFRAARDAAKAELVAAGLDKSGAREQIGKIVDTLGTAINRASEAAAKATKRTET